MLIRNEDLYELLNVKVGDRIKVIGGDGIEYGVRLEIVENGKFSFGPYDVGHALSKLIDVEFEKVDIKLFEPIQYETAIRRMANKEEVYIKYKGRRLKCILTKSFNNSKEKAIIVMYDNFTMETVIDFVKALDYEFYVLV